MKKAHLREAIVILFDKHYSKPISACVGTRLLSINGQYRCAPPPVARSISEPEAAAWRQIPDERIQAYLGHLHEPRPMPIPQRAASLTAAADAGRAPQSYWMKIQQLPPKFQAWALRQGGSQRPVDPPLPLAVIE
jgi:hypothetical protein